MDSAHHTVRKPLRIAQIVSLETEVPPKHQNGLEFVVSWLTEGLVARGHEVTLFAPEGSVTSAKLIATQPDRLRTDPDKENVWYQPFRSLWNTTVAAMQAEQFDIIHSHAHSIVFFAPFIKTPCVHTLHHPASHDLWKPWLNESAIRTQLTPIAQAHNSIHNVTVSQKQKELFQANGGDFFFKYIEVIRNGIPTKAFTPSYDTGKYLLYLGYLTPQKGAHIAIDMARRAGKKLIIAGSHFGMDEYFKTHIEPYLSEDITYVGPVDFEQKVELYKHAEALLVPLQWDEPFGLTLVEAMACGTPVIAFNRGAVSEIILQGKTGFICKDQEEALEALKKIDTIERRICREHAEKHFDVERMIDEYENFYYSLTSVR